MMTPQHRDPPRHRGPDHESVVFRNRPLRLAAGHAADDPPAAYDAATGAGAVRGMVERVQFVEALGFDWVSVSEHQALRRAS